MAITRLTWPAHTPHGPLAFRRGRTRRSGLRRSVRRGLVFMVAVVLAGCGEGFVRGFLGLPPAPVPIPIQRWDRAETTDQQFLTDRYACIQDVEAGRPSRSASDALFVFKACMAARGYRFNPSGRFGPPPGG